MSEEAKPAEHADAAAAVQEEPGASRPTDASNEPPLQFEKADFDEAPSCANCSQPIATTYYQVSTALVCASCRDLVLRSIDAGKGSQRFFRAALYGTVAATLGSVVWYAVREATGYEIGLVAIGVGIFVGMAVKRGAGGFGGAKYQALAMGLTYASIALTSLPLFVREVSQDGEISALKASFLFLLALASPFLQGFENIIGILIIGIGLYEAWKINRYVPPQILGPFEAAGARGGAAARAASAGG